MMTEERFYVKKVTKEERPKLFSSVGADYKYFIVDKNVSSMIFNFGVNTILADKVCDLLNKQQAMISERDNEIETLKFQVSALKYALKEIREIEVEIDVEGEIDDK